MAAIAVLKKADREILKAHMRCCVRDAVENGDTDQKLEELAAVIDKLG